MTHLRIVGLCLGGVPALLMACERTEVVRSIDEAGRVRGLPADGCPLLLDLTRLVPAERRRLSLRLGGLAVDSPWLRLRHRRGASDYGIYASGAAARRHRFAPLSYRALQNGGEPYRPEYSWSVHVARSGLACPLARALDGWNWGSALFDPCAGKASADLDYRIDAIRSIAARGEAGAAENAKYLRVSILPTEGGAGIHLAERVEERTTWFESWAHRNSWFGPFAERYRFSVGSSDPAVRLVAHSPAQINPSVDVIQSSGLVVGMALRQRAEVGAAGPKAGLELENGMSYSSIRSFRIVTHEYRIDNLGGSEPGQAVWQWDRDAAANACDWLSRRDAGSGCYFTGPLWDASPVFNAAAFSAISHKNFVPAFSATFAVAPQARQVSRFRIGASVTVAGLGGKVVPTPLFLIAQQVGTTRVELRFDSELGVDWSHPYFEAEAHVRLQALDVDDACLDAGEGGGAVTVQPCQARRAQLWGLDGQERYRSRSDAGRCLGVDAAGLAMLERCGNTLRQKWVWRGDRLCSRSRAGATCLGIVDGQPRLQAPGVGRQRWKPYLASPV